MGRLIEVLVRRADQIKGNPIVRGSGIPRKTVEKPLKRA